MPHALISLRSTGPPSQSLGVDPVNKEVMRRPPRAKNAPVLTTRLLYRILFSASMIVLGTLFIYGEELSDGETAQRDQTMVSLCRWRIFRRVRLTKTYARRFRPSRPSCFWIWSLRSRTVA